MQVLVHAPNVQQEVTVLIQQLQVQHPLIAVLVITVKKDGQVAKHALMERMLILHKVHNALNVLQAKIVQILQSLHQIVLQEHTEQLVITLVQVVQRDITA